MKYLILSALLITMSCGKHTSPKEQDLGDNDKDGRRNNEDSSPYISDMLNIGKIKGSMKIFTGPTKFITYDVNNLQASRENYLDLLTRSNLEHFLSKHELDATHLGINVNSEFAISQKEYRVDLRLDVVDGVEPGFLVMKNNGVAEKQIPWNRTISLVLSSEQLGGLLNYTATLHLLRSSGLSYRSHLDADKELKKSTYNVFQNADKASNIIVVSNKLPFRDFLKLRKIKATELVPLDLFFNAPTDTIAWWFTKIDSTNFALAKTSRSAMLANFENGFDKASSVIKKINGAELLSPAQNSRAGALHLYTIKGSRRLNTFKVIKEKKTYGLGDHDYYRCSSQYRKVIKVTEVPLEEDFLDTELLVVTKDGAMTLKQLEAKIEYNPEKREWKVAFKSPDDIVRFMLEKNTPETFTKTGLLKAECDRDQGSPKPDTKITNVEESVSLKIEALVEKIN